MGKAGTVWKDLMKFFSPAGTLIKVTDETQGDVVPLADYVTCIASCKRNEACVFCRRDQRQQLQQSTDVDFPAFSLGQTAYTVMSV